MSTITRGDRVLLSCVSACGRCRFCKEGRYGQCLGGGGWIFGHTINGLQAAERCVAACEAAVAEVDDAVARHSGLTDRLARLTLDRAKAAKRLDAALAAAETVRKLTERLVHARALAVAEKTRILMALEAEDAFLRWEESSQQAARALRAATSTC